MEDLQQAHKIDYSVVVPVFNGANSITDLCKRIIDFFASTNFSFEIILIDDGSVDESWEVIKKIKKNYPGEISGIKLSRNFGQHNATCSGFIEARGEFIVTIDDDLEESPEDIILLIEKQKETGANLVFGIHKDTNQSFLRKGLKAIYIKVGEYLEGRKKIKGSSFRLIRTNLAKKVAEKAGFFVFIDEVLFDYTGKIETVKVSRNKGYRNKSNYSIFNLINLVSEIVMFYSNTSIRVIKKMGFFFALVNFIIGLYFLFKYYFLGIPVQGYTSLIVSILFSTGVIVFFLGVIAEYIGKIFSVLNNRIVYSVDEKV